MNETKQLHMNFDDDEFENKNIIISLLPRYYHQTVIAQTKKTEYRRGRFIKHPVTAFVYSTLSHLKEDQGYPKGEIGGVILLGSPIEGKDLVIQKKEQEEPNSRSTMEEWLDGFSTASAHPILSAVKFKSPVTLKEIKFHFPKFNPPQRFMYLERDSKLLEFLKSRI